MTAIGATMRSELIGLGGIVERNVYLTKRYFLWDVAFMIWTIANTLTIVFIARSVHLTAAAENVLATRLLVGAVIWAFLGIIFEFMTETVAWERWEGTIEYTFMAPISRVMHLGGQGAYAVLYGLIRATILFFAVVLFIGIHIPHANFGAAFALLAIASLSFIGVGMMTSVLPLISPEKGAQLGFVAQGLMLVVSGVYYPVSVMPNWMQFLSKLSPATYALRGDRASIVNGTGLVWADVWPLLIIAALATPIGLAVFHRGEQHAKKHGKLKRSGWMSDWFAEHGRGAVRRGHGRWSIPSASGHVVDFLVDLARGGAALELGIGTGSIALPLAQRGVPSRHRTLSGAMVARLRAKPGGDDDPRDDRRLGDDARRRDVHARLSRQFNTIMNLTRRTSRSRASRTRPPISSPAAASSSRSACHRGGNLEVFDSERHARRRRRVGADDAASRIASLQAPRRLLGAALGPVLRRVAPGELDLMARLAGMRLRERWSGWNREPFTAETTRHVSVWEKPA